MRRYQVHWFLPLAVTRRARWRANALLFLSLFWAATLLDVRAINAQSSPRPRAANQPKPDGTITLAVPATASAPPPAPPAASENTPAPAPDESARGARKERERPYGELHAARVRELTSWAGKFQASCEKAPTDEFCKSFCASTTPGVPIDLCSFTDPVAANAAVLIDWPTVQRLMAAEVLYRKARAPQEDDNKPGPKNLQIPTVASVVGAEVGLAGDVASVAVNALEVGLAALAKVIEDRAKREGIGWFLQRVGDDLCGLGAPSADASTELVRREIRAFWLPSLCALAADAKSSGFVQYGGGGKLFETLRAALARDVEAWPGVAAGLGLGHAFFKAAGVTPKPASLFECTPPEPRAAIAASRWPQSDLCRATMALRRDGASFLARIRAGQSATASLSTLASRLSAENRHLVGSNMVLYDDGLQIAACAASIPFFFDEHGEMLSTVERIKTVKAGETAVTPDTAGSLDRAQRTATLLVAAMSGTPACWTIVGKGVDRATCEPLRGRTRVDAGGRPTVDGACATAGATALAQTKGDDIERLSTVLRLSRRFSASAQLLESQWGNLIHALYSYEDATRASAQTPGQTPRGLTPDLSKVSDAKSLPELGRALQELAQAEARALHKSAYVRQVQAALALTQAGFDMAGTTLDVADGVLDPELYPGLSYAGNHKAAELERKIESARASLSALSRDVDALSAVFAEDWGAVIAHAAESLRVHAGRACSSSACRESADKLSRYAGFVVALVGETDAERLADTLDSLADPVGGWTTKSQARTFTASIAAFPGFAGGIEWRAGQYGVHGEDFGRAYGVAPTLVLPVGIDLAWGTADDATISPAGLFISLLDPAAFLQYDAAEQGRLPGPRLTTALAPGVWGRFAFRGTPFTLNPFIVFRPGLRSWEGGVSGPAASAFQLGIAAAIDVTLFGLYTDQEN
ncbi:hypothetical protein WME94_43520 [Sorangium sp. So ce429]